VRYKLNLKLILYSLFIMSVLTPTIASAQMQHGTGGLMLWAIWHIGKLLVFN
jgi:hypothetical protein